MEPPDDSDDLFVSKLEALRFRMATLGFASAPSAAPRSYLSAGFDTYASVYDEHVTQQLRYRAPRALMEVLLPYARHQHPIVLDVGCGTGLMGCELRPHCEVLHGIDVSDRMLELARERAIYDHLAAADATEYLKTVQGTYQMIVAADVLPYLGSVGLLFEAAARALDAEGLLAFTAEYSQVEPHYLSSHGRYKHAPSYISDELRAAGFRLQSMVETVLRDENGQAVPGLAVVAVGRHA